jgi:hypothetical protein
LSGSSKQPAALGHTECTPSLEWARRLTSGQGNNERNLSLAGGLRASLPNVKASARTLRGVFLGKTRRGPSKSAKNCIRLAWHRCIFFRRRSHTQPYVRGTTAPPLLPACCRYPPRTSLCRAPSVLLIFIYHSSSFSVFPFPPLLFNESGVAVRVGVHPGVPGPQHTLPRWQRAPGWYQGILVSFVVCVCGCFTRHPSHPAIGTSMNTTDGDTIPIMMCSLDHSWSVP